MSFLYFWQNTTNSKQSTIFRLEAEADKKFDNIINGMMAGFLTDNLIETGRFTKMFQFHIQQFGLRMSKEMLLNLVRFFYEVLIKEHQHTDLIMVACEAFKNMMDLVKPRRFGWRDHTLDWRPLRQLHYQVFLKKMTPDLEDDCKHPLFYFALFYDPSEHQAIWETILQEIPIGNQDQTELLIDICWRFLSVYGMTEEVSFFEDILSRLFGFHYGNTQQKTKIYLKLILITVQTF